MDEYTYLGRYAQRYGHERMMKRRKHEWVRFLWFIIAATFVIHFALLWEVDKSFY
jgi:hypothetical protein